MFSADVYKKRRDQLKKSMNGGLLLFLGNNESPMNYTANTYHFRQDSTFLYFFGVDLPGFMGLIDLDDNKSWIVGEDFSIDDIIWIGPQPKMAEWKSKSGTDDGMTPKELDAKIQLAIQGRRQIHFLPPYRPENRLFLSKLLGIEAEKIKQYASTQLIKAIVSQREIKSAFEVNEIEKALEISYEMVDVMMKRAKPGVFEYEVVGAVDAVVASNKSHYSFPIILSKHGETLHNHNHFNRLEKGDLLVCDSGAESPEHYASDITRTLPVGGQFTPMQKDIYAIVLAAQEAGFAMIKPGVPFKEAHLAAAKTICLGLKTLGIMRGHEEDAVAEGAHALFFPHGLGHMMGLDVHDMEDYGENHIGYSDQIERSNQFGLAYLRMAKPVVPGHVLTVEPGLYFIPELIDMWSKENKLSAFIDYHRVDAYRGFGGIRIEDNVLVTERGHRVLGKPIPKKIEEIESIMGSF